MNTTTMVRIAEYGGSCAAGLLASLVLAGPALAMQPPGPDPVPGSEQHHKIFDSLDGRDGPAPTTSTEAEPAPASDGTDWSTLVAALTGGSVVAGGAVLGATQLRRRQAHPA